jgi:hypothetical protein
MTRKKVSNWKGTFQTRTWLQLVKQMDPLKLRPLNGAEVISGHQLGRLRFR